MKTFPLAILLALAAVVARADATFGNLHSFSVFSGGANPQGGLTLGPDGYLYGATENGGTNGGYGTLFKTTTNGVATSLYSFTSGSDGSAPQAGLTAGLDGSLYGTTSSGGDNYSGTFFKITTNGLFSVLGQFGDTFDGYSPGAQLLLGKDGNFYGSTPYGGASNNGAIFRVTSGGQFTELYAFTGLGDGTTPVGALAQGPDGLLYGVTSYGGATNFGSVFKISTAGAFATIYSFGSLVDANGYFLDGTTPLAGLTLGANGNFYGTTSYGGTNSSGTVFQITTNGILTPLYSFGAITEPTTGDLLDGYYPDAALTLGPDGNLYGTTQGGGSKDPSNYGDGTVFQITPDGALTTLYSFGGGADGSFPQAPLALVNGALYGEAFGVNPGGNGSLFKITTNGAFSALYSFPGTDDGSNPSAGLTLAPDGTLYGTTEGGGTSGNGTLFRINRNGGFNVLVEFNGTNGSGPECDLVLSADGNLYGTTLAGGAAGLGTVFKLASDGTLTSLYSFGLQLDSQGNSVDGSSPWAGVIQGADGNLYGTTTAGGAYSTNGTIFKITTNGVLTTLYSFDGANGAVPIDTLVQGVDGGFYGTTSIAGKYGNGTVFRITSDGSLTTLYSFIGGNDGGNPQAGLVQGTNGLLYGTTYGGGTASSGTVFQITTNGVLTTLAGFNGQGSFGSSGALVIGPDGSIYGTTVGGGPDGYGSIYRLTPDGVITVLHSFTFVTDGSGPDCGLRLGADGSLYGVAEYGGAGGSGTLYRIMVTPVYQAAAVTKGVFNFSWSTIAGLSYQVQVSTNLALGKWNNLASPFLATGATTSASDPLATNGHRFYRTVLLP